MEILRTLNKTYVQEILTSTNKHIFKAIILHHTGQSDLPLDLNNKTISKNISFSIYRMNNIPGKMFRLQ